MDKYDEAIGLNVKKGMKRYLIFNNGQYRDIVEAKNQEEALTKAIQKGYEGTIELQRMKKYENLGATALRNLLHKDEIGKLM